MRLVLMPVFAALLAVPVRDRHEQPEQADLVGSYALYTPNANPEGTAVAMMRIVSQDGKRFVIRIAAPTGNPSVDWQGKGVIDGKEGHYDWVFPNGWSGRTTITIDASGHLKGQVRGSGIDWDYIGKRVEGPVKMPGR